MAGEMQQIVCWNQEVEADLPLRLRLRRSWSFGDLWNLRKECEDDFLSYPDCPSPVSNTPNKSDKFTDDGVSTCAGDDTSSISDETCTGDCSVPVSPKLDWAEEMESETPKSQGDPPGILATPFESFALPPGQWAGTFGQLDGPFGGLVGAPETWQSVGGILSRHGNFARQSPNSGLVQLVKSIQRSNPEAWFRYTAECGENVRDPRRHTVQFLEAFLHQYNAGTSAASTAARSKLDAPLGPLGKFAGRFGNGEKSDVPAGNLHATPGKKFLFPGKLADLPEKSNTPPGQLHAPAAEKSAVPLGNLASPPGTMCAPPGKLHLPR